MGGKSSSTTTGYKYSMSILMGLADAVQDIVQIKVGSMVAWTGPLAQSTNGNATATQPVTGASAIAVPIKQGSLFGGDKAEGGIVGAFDFYDGDPAQLLQQRVKTAIMNGNEVATATADGSSLIAFPKVDKDADDSVNDGAPKTGNPNIPINYVKKAVDVSEFRRAATLWYTGTVCSNNPYPKEWKVRVRRSTAGWDGDAWYPERAQILLSDPEALAEAATDAGANTSTQQATTNTSPSTTALLLPDNGQIIAMNPAHIIYECLTNRNWGRGLDRTLLDDASFTSAANWLYSEGFGLCLKWSKADDLSSFLQGVIDTVGASLYTDRSTGLMTLKLIRADYAISDLPTFDYESGIIDITDSDNTAATRLINEVIVVWHSPISDVDRKVRAQNIASIQALGCTNSDTKQYPGIPVAQLANRVAQRDLQASAYGIRSFTIKFDRRGFKLMPGMCFVIKAPDRGISQMVLRCVAISDGTLEDGVITINAAQDVFGLPNTTFGQTQQTQFNATNKNPQPVTYSRLMEGNYRDAILNIGSDAAEALDPSQTSVGDLTVAPTSLSTSYNMFSMSAGEAGFTAGGVQTFTEYMQMGAACGPYDTVINLIGIDSDSNLDYPFCALVDDEFMRVDSYDYTTGNCAVARGCIDSVPAAHAAGAIVWDYDTVATDDREYVVGEIVTFKEQTVTATGFLNVDAAPPHSIQTVGRQGRPWPPCNVTINGPYSATGYSVTAKDLTISWSVRNRLFVQDNLLGYNAATQTPEVGQTTTVRVRSVATGKLLDQIDGIVGTGYVYTQARAIQAGVSGAVQFEIYSLRGGLTSIFANIYPVIYYPAAVAGAIGLGKFSLTGTAAAVAVVTGVQTATFGLTAIEAGTSGSLASSTGGFSFGNEWQVGTTIGGWYMRNKLFLSGTATGSAPAIGVSSGNIALTSKLGDTTAFATSTAGFKITSGAVAIHNPGYGDSYGQDYGSY